jgi:hypothetical protein
MGKINNKKTINNFVFLFIFIIGVIIISYLYMKNSNNIIVTNNNKTNLNIERSCLKSVVSSKDFNRIIKSNCLIPSYFNGIYIDTNYSTYYDFPTSIIYKNRKKSKDTSIPSAIRIRSYKSSPDQFIEIKFKGGLKIRGLLDSDNNLSYVSKKNYKILTKYLNMIENGELIQVISNSYDRQSFILNKDPLIRVTVDSNLVFMNKKNTFAYDKQIIELKIPKNYDEKRIEEITKYLSNDCNIRLKFVEFSKFDYGFERIKNLTDYFRLQSYFF